MMKGGVTFTLACILSAAAFAVACSSSSNTGNGTPDGGTSAPDSGTSNPKPDSGTTGGGNAGDSGTPGDDDDTTPDSGPTDNPDLDCPNAGGAQACNQCCQGNHDEGANTYLQALLGCACADDLCGPVCEKTICAAQPSQPDQACITCVQGTQSPDAGKSCLNDESTACKANADCMALVQCASACPKQ